MKLKHWIKKTIGLNGTHGKTTELHEANIREIQKTTESIETLNKALVRNSRAYQIYIATGKGKL